MKSIGYGTEYFLTNRQSISGSHEPYLRKFAILKRNNGEFVREELKTMKIAALRRPPEWVMLGVIIMAVAVGGALRVLSGQEVRLASDSSQPRKPQTANGVEPLESSVGPLSAQLQDAGSPNSLLIATPSAEEHLADLPGTGRPDPFSSVLQAAPRPTTETSSASSEVATAHPNSSNVNADASQPLPTTAVSGTVDLPPVPSVTLAPLPPPLPTIPVANTPVAIPSVPTSYTSPRDPMQSLELTGVVQMGDRVAVIVRESDGRTSRHLFAGDLLAGGQIRVKSIDLSSQEPLVIFEYQGKDHPRVVGSGGPLGVS